MEIGFSFSTFLGSIVIIAGLIWLARATLKRIFGRIPDKRSTPDF